MTQPGQGGRGINPMLAHLISKYDMDSGDFRPLFYSVEVVVPIGLQGIGRGSVSINNQPFIWLRTAHSIVGDVSNPAVSNLWNDGQYDVNFRDDEAVYQRDFALASLVFGGYGSAQGGQQGGYPIDMPYPIPFAGNRTVSFEVRNRVLRAPADASQTFTVQFVMHGIGSWGKPRQRQV